MSIQTSEENGSVYLSSSPPIYKCETCRRMYKLEETLKLPCGCIFCKRCIFDQFSQSVNCPLCFDSISAGFIFQNFSGKRFLKLFLWKLKEELFPWIFLRSLRFLLVFIALYAISSLWSPSITEDSTKNFQQCVELIGENDLHELQNTVYTCEVSYPYLLMLCKYKLIATFYGKLSTIFFCILCFITTLI